LLRGQIRDGVFSTFGKDFPKIEMDKLGDGNWVFAVGSRRIGVSTQSLTKQLAEYFGVQEGVLISSVSEDSPAAKAGLKAGDVITAIDGEKVSSSGDITRALSKKETGDVSLTVVRDRNTRTVTVTPEKNPNAGVFKTGTMGPRTIVIPSVSVPAVPEINVTIPPIVVPATPPIQVTVPTKAPRVLTRTVII
jgi:membrane-associated protease RseP (regulator of RpoE activity)